VAIVSILPLITEITPATRATMISLFIAALSLGRALGDLVTPWLFRGGFMVNAAVCAGLDILALLVLTRIRLPKERA
jgi:MFS family permease